MPSDCVASARAIDVRSAGNAGHGPSSSFEIASPASSRMRSVCSPGTITSLPSNSMRQPSRSKPSLVIRRSPGTVSLIRSSPPVTAASATNDPISM
jgi:hypothetical protein